MYTPSGLLRLLMRSVYRGKPPHLTGSPVSSSCSH
jgi:hypothetical protein